MANLFPVAPQALKQTYRQIAPWLRQMGRENAIKSPAFAFFDLWTSRHVAFFSAKNGTWYMEGNTLLPSFSFYFHFHAVCLEKCQSVRFSFWSSGNKGDAQSLVLSSSTYECRSVRKDWNVWSSPPSSWFKKELLFNLFWSPSQKKLEWIKTRWTCACMSWN